MSSTNNTTGTTGKTHGASTVGRDTMGAIKSGLTGIHGAGEAIRGNINQVFDSASGDTNTKNEAIAQRGVSEMETGNYQSHNAGVSPADQDASATRGTTGLHHSTVPAGATTTTTSTTAPGTSTGYGHGVGSGSGVSNGVSTNHGPHSSNLANKVDPTVDSDRDHRANPLNTTGTTGTTGTTTASHATGAPVTDVRRGY